MEHGAIFIYDGHPGGVGLCEQGYDSIEKLLQCEIIHYCKKDVEITRGLFRFGVENGHLLYEKKGAGW